MPGILYHGRMPRRSRGGGLAPCLFSVLLSAGACPGLSPEPAPADGRGGDRARADGTPRDGAAREGGAAHPDAAPDSDGAPGGCDAACASGLTCEKGACVCNAASCPAGCCSASGAQPQCLAGNSTSACGTGGVACQACTASGFCREAACSNGKCGTPVQSGHCLIKEECLLDKTAHATDPCRACDSAASQTDWTFQERAGCVSTYAGACGVAGKLTASTTALQARFTSPRGLGLDGSGDLFVADTANHRLQVFTAAGVDTMLFNMQAVLTRPAALGIVDARTGAGQDDVAYGAYVFALSRAAGIIERFISYEHYTNINPSDPPPL